MKKRRMTALILALVVVGAGTGASKPDKIGRGHCQTHPLKNLSSDWL